MPIFSIIVPTYNCDRFLAATINSVLDQTEQNFELLIIDDGSSDTSLKIAEDFSKKDSRIKVSTQKNSGKPAIPRNKGISDATGELITFLDGDDLYLNCRLEKIAEVFDRHPEVDFVFHDIFLIDIDGKKLGETFLAANDYVRRATPYLEPKETGVFLCRPSFFGFMATEIAGTTTIAMTVRATALARQIEWFPADLTLMEDYDLWFRLALDGQGAFLNEPLSCYRKYFNSISSNTEQFSLDQVEAHRRNYERGRLKLTDSQRITYRRKIADMYASIGYRMAKNGKISVAWRHYMNSLQTMPQIWVATALIKSTVASILPKMFKP